MSAPFITVYTIDGRANKLVTRRKGKVCKEAGSPMLSVIETFGTSERVNYRRIWLLLF